jgi:hypothetical protein
MRRTVVVKGIAGLGNRMQVLGHCCDLASRWKAVLCVDWTHNSWSESFDNYFQLACPSEKAFLRPEGGFGKVVPSRYTHCVTRDPLQSQEWLKGDFLTDLDQRPEGPLGYRCGLWLPGPLLQSTVSPASVESGLQAAGCGSNEGARLGARRL